MQDKAKGENGVDRGRSRGTEEGRTEARSAFRKSRHEERRRAEEEHKRKLVEIENDDGLRGSGTEREVKRRNQDEKPDPTRVTT